MRPLFVKLAQSPLFGFVFRGPYRFVERRPDSDPRSIDVHHPGVEHVTPANATIFKKCGEPTSD
jgi:hypothetical protein